MPTFQVLAVRGHEDETLHVERHDPDDAELAHLVATSQARANGQWQKCDVIGQVEAGTAKEALDVAYERFVRRRGHENGHG